MPRYSNIPIIKSDDNEGTRVYSTTRYPKIPLSQNDIYVLTNAGDRLDILADQFYGDPNLWWVISVANGELPQNSLNIPVGSQLRIPPTPGNILNSFNQLNNV